MDITKYVLSYNLHLIFTMDLNYWLGAVQLYIFIKYNFLIT